MYPTSDGDVGPPPGLTGLWFDGGPVPLPTVLQLLPGAAAPAALPAHHG